MPEPQSPTRRLHIGGTVRREGWEVFNILAGEHVDHLGNAGDLSRFADGTFDSIYASHVLEHFDYVGELQAALNEWSRVLKPGGQAMISVPDLDVLAQLLIAKGRLTREERFDVVRMMFGGHVDRHDYHVAGLNQEILGDYLQRAGFTKITRVRDLGLFDDTSRMLFKGVPISLNVIAEKP